MESVGSTSPIDEDATGSVPVACDALSVVPRQLGPIRLVREIGRGGMGAVWLGHHEVLDRDVAVKFLLTISAERDSAAVKVFLEGARAAAAVRHPGLTTIHHADVVGDVPYIVMDWVDGASLSQVLRRNGPLSVAQAMSVLRSACDVLIALHDAGIVHRDIKPSNMLIDRGGRLYLTDFGLTCDRVPPGRSITVGCAGTPGYMSPEMFDGVVSPRTDVYALGVTGYELLTGELPAPSGKAAGHEGSLRSGEEILPHEPLTDRSVPPQVIALLERLTNPNAMFRPKHARQALAAIEEGDRNGAGASHEARLAELIKGEPARAKVVEEKGSSATLSELVARKRTKTESFRPIAPARGELEGNAESASLPCQNCGHILKGVAITRICPECELPIAVSRDPRRLKHGAMATWSMLLAAVFLADVVVMTSLTFVLGPLSLRASFEPQVEFMGELTARFVMPALWIVLALGCWKMCAFPVPLKRVERWRKAARTSALVLLLASVVWISPSDSEDESLLMAYRVVGWTCVLLLMQFVRAASPGLGADAIVRLSAVVSLGIGAQVLVLIADAFPWNVVLDDEVSTLLYLAGVLAVVALAHLGAPWVLWRFGKAAREFGRVVQPEGREYLHGDVVKVSLPCVRCAQDLKGIPFASACSECGLPVPSSLAFDRVLLLSEPALRSLILKIRLMACGLFLLLAAASLPGMLYDSFVWLPAFVASGLVAAIALWYVRPLAESIPDRELVARIRFLIALLILPLPLTALLAVPAVLLGVPLWILVLVVVSCVPISNVVSALVLFGFARRLRKILPLSEARRAVAMGVTWHERTRQSG